MAAIIGGGSGALRDRVARVLTAAAMRGRPIDAGDDEEALEQLRSTLAQVVVVCVGAGGSPKHNPFDVLRRLDEVPDWERRPVLVVLSELGRVTFDMMLAQHQGHGLLTPQGLDCLLLIREDDLDDREVVNAVARHVVRVASRSRRTTNPEYGTIAAYPEGWLEPRREEASPRSSLGGSAPS